MLELLQPKKSRIIKYSKRCRDLNREYESNNNADLDNGVYNAFVNEQELEAEQQKKRQQEEYLKLQNIEHSPNVSLNCTSKEPAINTIESHGLPADRHSRSRSPPLSSFDDCNVVFNDPNNILGNFNQKRSFHLPGELLHQNLNSENNSLQDSFH